MNKSRGKDPNMTYRQEQSLKMLTLDLLEWMRLLLRELPNVGVNSNIKGLGLLLHFVYWIGDSKLTI